MSGSIDRRQFIKRIGAAGLAVGFAGPFKTGRAPNSTVNVAVIGVASRGRADAVSFAKATGAHVGWIVDVDERYLADAIKDVAGVTNQSPEGLRDFRTLLENPDVDAFVIAAPDHWHAPMSILAMQAGKDVYVEKPCGHNPREGELLVDAQRKYNKIVQMGTQQRSAPPSIQAIQEIRDGIIGTPYYGKAWYANTRGSIGRGQVVPAPDTLDWDLWQGPAPRVDYHDNYHPYNWHWFWNWGTGEVCNNGTHEVDVCRWALGVDFPERVTSAGGRYHFDDDWEFYDTQVVSFDFPDGKSISWEGRSCNGLPFYNRGRGATIHGTEGTILVDRDGYILYDLQNKEVKRVLQETGTDALNTQGADILTDIHAQNFIDAIRDGKPLNQPIEEGHKSTLLCHLGNIAQHTGRTVQCDPQNGHIVGDDEAAAMWTRTYEPGWEPKV